MFGPILTILGILGAGVFSWIISSLRVGDLRDQIDQQEDDLFEAQTLISDLRIALDRKGREIAGNQALYKRELDAFEITVDRMRGQLAEREDQIKALRICLNHNASGWKEVTRIRNEGAHLADQIKALLDTAASADLEVRLRDAFEQSGIKDEDFEHATH